MNGVTGMLDLLLASPLSPEQQDCAKTVQASAEALLVVINDILEFSSIRKRQAGVGDGAIRAGAGVNEVCALLGVQAPAERAASSTRIWIPPCPACSWATPPGCARS